jgi:hypothetical protein
MGKLIVFPSRGCSSPPPQSESSNQQTPEQRDRRVEDVVNDLFAAFGFPPEPGQEHGWLRGVMRLLNLPPAIIAEAESLFRLGWDVGEVAKQVGVTPEQARRIRQALMARDAKPGSFPKRKKKRGPNHFRARRKVTFG